MSLYVNSGIAHNNVRRYDSLYSAFMGHVVSTQTTATT